MMFTEEVKKLLQPAFPNAQIFVGDLTGSQDHFQIQVVSEVFKGKTLIEQHQLVQTALQDALSDGRIHAIAIKTCTPEKWKKEQSGGFNILH